MSHWRGGVRCGLHFGSPHRSPRLNPGTLKGACTVVHIRRTCDPTDLVAPPIRLHESLYVFRVHRPGGRDRAAGITRSSRNNWSGRADHDTIQQGRGHGDLHVTWGANVAIEVLDSQGNFSPVAGIPNSWNILADGDKTYSLQQTFTSSPTLAVLYLGRK